MTDYKAEYERLAEAARDVVDAWDTDEDYNDKVRALERALPAAGEKHPSCGAWHQVDTERVCTCADAARVATERAEKAAQERIANVHSAAYRDGFTNGTEAERARCLAVGPNPDEHHMTSETRLWRSRIASGEMGK